MEIKGKSVTPFEIEDINGLFEATSFVFMPASESNFYYFSKEEDNELFKVFESSEEQRKVKGVVLRANYPIARKVNGELVYKYFTPEFIEDCVLSASKNGLFNKIDIHHNGKPVQGIHLLQSYILPEDSGDIAAGSWIAEYKVDNNEVWNKIKSGELRGFSPSLPGLALSKEENLMFKSLKAKVEKLFNMQFASVETEKGILTYKELVEGSEVFLEDPEGNLVTPENGEYEIDGKIVNIADGLITNVTEKEAEEPKSESEVEVAEDAVSDMVDVIEGELVSTGEVTKESFDTLVTLVNDLVAKVEALSTPTEETQFSAVPFIKEKDLKDEQRGKFAVSNYKWTKTEI